MPKPNEKIDAQEWNQSEYEIVERYDAMGAAAVEAGVQIPGAGSVPELNEDGTYADSSSSSGAQTTGPDGRGEAAQEGGGKAD